MGDLIRFVDSISATPTVRLDLNDEANGWAVTSFSAPAPRLRRSVTANAMRDGISVGSSSYDGRTLSVGIDIIKSLQDTAAVELQKLVRELDREINFLEYRQNGATKSVFFCTFRADVTQLQDVIAQAAFRQTSIEIPAEPFALGLKETLGPFTVNNDPTAASNGHFVDVSGAIGDVAAPLLVRDTGTHGPGGYLAVRQHGTPSFGPQCTQLDSSIASVAMGTDTTTPAASNDPVMAGAGSPNYSRTTFATNASLVTRLTVSALGGTSDRNGTYRALVVVRRSDATSAINLQAVATSRGVVSTANKVVVPASTARQVVDLGIISLGADQQEGVFGSTLHALEASIDLRAERTSGSGTLDWDYIVFLPADESLMMFRRRSTVAYPNAMVIDGANGVVNSRHPSLQTQIVSDDFDVAGGFPLLKPSISQRFYYVVTDLFAAPYTIDKTITSTLTFEYYPRYLYVRPVAS